MISLILAFGGRNSPICGRGFGHGKLRERWAVFARLHQSFQKRQYKVQSTECKVPPSVLVAAAAAAAMWPCRNFRKFFNFNSDPSENSPFVEAAAKGLSAEDLRLIKSKR
jgi:hypothetical protein